MKLNTHDFEKYAGNFCVSPAAAEEWNRASGHVAYDRRSRRVPVNVHTAPQSTRIPSMCVGCRRLANRCARLQERACRPFRPMRTAPLSASGTSGGRTPTDGGRHQSAGCRHASPRAEPNDANAAPGDADVAIRPVATSVTGADVRSHQAGRRVLRPGGAQTDAVRGALADHIRARGRPRPVKPRSLGDEHGVG